MKEIDIKKTHSDITDGHLTSLDLSNKILLECIPPKGELKQNAFFPQNILYRSSAGSLIINEQKQIKIISPLHEQPIEIINDSSNPQLLTANNNLVILTSEKETIAVNMHNHSVMPLLGKLAKTAILFANDHMIVHANDGELIFFNNEGKTIKTEQYDELKEHNEYDKSGKFYRCITELIKLSDQHVAIIGKNTQRYEDKVREGGTYQGWCHFSGGQFFHVTPNQHTSFWINIFDSSANRVSGTSFDNLAGSGLIKVTKLHDDKLLIFGKAQAFEYVCAGSPQSSYSSKNGISSHFCNRIFNFISNSHEDIPTEIVEHLKVNPLEILSSPEWPIVIIKEEDSQKMAYYFNNANKLSLSKRMVEYVWSVNRNAPGWLHMIDQGGFIFVSSEQNPENFKKEKKAYLIDDTYLVKLDTHNRIVIFDVNQPLYNGHSYTRHPLKTVTGALLAVLPNKHLLITDSSNSNCNNKTTLFIYNIVNGTISWLQNPNNGKKNKNTTFCSYYLEAIALSTKHLVTMGGSTVTTIKIWDLEIAQCIHSIDGLKGNLQRLSDYHFAIIDASSLTIINIANKRALNVADIVPLMQSLNTNSTITTCTLRGIALNKPAAINAIAEMLQNNQTLVSLDISNTQTGNEGVKIIIKALQNNPNHMIKEINIDGNLISAANKKLLQDAINKKNNPIDKPVNKAENQELKQILALLNESLQGQKKLQNQLEQQSAKIADLETVIKDKAAKIDTLEQANKELSANVQQLTTEVRALKEPTNTEKKAITQVSGYSSKIFTFNG